MHESNGLLWIQISNGNKLDTFGTITDLLPIDFVINEMGLDYFLSYTEFAIDTADLDLWREMAMAIFPSWLRLRKKHFFNYCSGHYQQGHISNPDGMYVWRRDCRRRQIYAHIKRCASGEVFGRIECRAFRPYLKSVKLPDGKIGIFNYDDVIAYGQDAVEAGKWFSLKKLDLDALRKDLRAAKNWSLEGLPATEQYRRIVQNGEKRGLLRKDARSYFKEIAFPEIIWSLDRHRYPERHIDSGFEVHENRFTPESFMWEAA